MKPSMYDYIVRQPEILERVLDQSEDYARVFSQALQEGRIETVIFTGSGTSHHVSTAAAALCQKSLPLDARAVLPMQFVHSRILHPERTLVVGISQSGNSLSTLEALKHAKEAGCATLAFSLEKDSLLVSLCDFFMPLVCERELVPPETQGYTAALLEWMIAVRVAAGQDFSDLRQGVGSLVQTVAMSEAFVQDNLRDLVRFGRLSVTASGLHYATALEGTLKIRETTRKAVMAVETEELAHVADLAFEDDDCLLAIVRTPRDDQVAEMVQKITDRVFCFDQASFPVSLAEDISLIHAVIPFQMIGALVARATGVDTSIYPYDIENISHGEDFLFR